MHTINTRAFLPNALDRLQPICSHCPATVMTCMPPEWEKGQRLLCRPDLAVKPPSPHWPQCSPPLAPPNSFLRGQVQGRSMKFWSQIKWKSQLIAFPLCREGSASAVPTSAAPPSFALIPSWSWWLWSLPIKEIDPLSSCSQHPSVRPEATPLCSLTNFSPLPPNPLLCLSCWNSRPSESFGNKKRKEKIPCMPALGEMWT